MRPGSSSGATSLPSAGLPPSPALGPSLTRSQRCPQLSSFLHLGLDRLRLLPVSDACIMEFAFSVRTPFRRGLICTAFSFSNSICFCYATRGQHRTVQLELSVDTMCRHLLCFNLLGRKALVSSEQCHESLSNLIREAGRMKFLSLRNPHLRCKLLCAICA